MRGMRVTHLGEEFVVFRGTQKTDDAKLRDWKEINFTIVQTPDNHWPKSRQVTWVQRVVPVTMKSMGFQTERSHLVVRDLLARFVFAGIE